MKNIKRKSLRAAFASLVICCLGLSLAGVAWAYTVACVGDSLTEYGYARYMDAICSGNTSYDWNVIEDGLPGFKAQDVYVYSATHGWKNQGADIVLIMVGTNDMVHGTNQNRDTYVDGVVSWVQRIIDYYTYDNAEERPRVIVSAIPPSTDPTITALADYYNHELENALQGYGVDIFMTSNWVDFYDSSAGGAKSSMYSDYLHPTQDGYYAMAENFFDAIRALFQPDYFKSDSTLHKMPDYQSL